MGGWKIMEDGGMGGWLSSGCRLGNPASSGRKWGTSPFYSPVSWNWPGGFLLLSPPDSNTMRGRHRWPFTAPCTYLSQKGTCYKNTVVPTEYQGGLEDQAGGFCSQKWHPKSLRRMVWWDLPVGGCHTARRGGSPDSPVTPCLGLPDETEVSQSTMNCTKTIVF